MRKYMYLLTMNFFPVYFTALLIGIIIFALFLAAPGAHAQTNSVIVPRILSSPLHQRIMDDYAAVSAGNKILSDEWATVKLETSLSDQYLKIQMNRAIKLVMVYDSNNNVVDEALVDIKNNRIDISGICQGIYYLRVDYSNGSTLRRVVIQ